MNIELGHPTRRIVRWEATATAFTVFSASLLIFHLTFIEIRHLSTGELLQIIQGNGIACVGEVYLTMMVNSSEGGLTRRPFYLEPLSPLEKENTRLFTCCKRVPK